eukprot:4695996-Amphidinium_carterae.1
MLWSGLWSQPLATSGRFSAKGNVLRTKSVSALPWKTKMGGTWSVEVIHQHMLPKPLCPQSCHSTCTAALGKKSDATRRLRPARS